MKSSHQMLLAIALVFVAVLPGCGGGGSGSTAPTSPSAPPSTNAAPVAVAGPAQSVLVGATVTLTGSASSDSNGDPLTYSWTLTARPAQSNAALSNPASVNPTFIADVTGTYVATLIVNDGKVNSSPSTVTIAASVANAAPVANAGPSQNVVAGTLVALSGVASSDANGDPLSYAWTLTTKPQGSSTTLANPTSVNPTFTADLAGTYVATLIVNDGKVNSAPSSVTVAASLANAAPVANAGPAQSVVAGALVTLDGGASTDANADPLTYAWTLTSKPIGSVAALSNPTAVKPSFTAEVAGSYVATLVVNDGKLNSSPSTVTVGATSVPFDSLQGSWDAIASARVPTADPTTLTVTINGNLLTIRAEQFIDGTCLYTANLTPTRDGIGPGTYQCSDFTSGTWQLSEMRRVDLGDVYIRMVRNGSEMKRMYGMKPGGSTSAQAVPEPIVTLAGSYDGIGTGGPFGTEPADPQLAVSGSTLTLTVARFFSGTCEYTGTLSVDGKSVTNATFRCSDFSTGTWSLLDLRSIGGQDLYVSLLAAGNLRRAYGLR